MILKGSHNFISPNRLRRSFARKCGNKRGETLQGISPLSSRQTRLHRDRLGETGPDCTFQQT